MLLINVLAIVGMTLPMQALGADTACPTRADLKNGIISEITYIIDLPGATKTTVRRQTYKLISHDIISTSNKSITTNGRASSAPISWGPYLRYKGLFQVSDKTFKLNGAEMAEVDSFFPLRVLSALIFPTKFGSENDRREEIIVWQYSHRRIAECDLEVVVVISNIRAEDFPDGIRYKQIYIPSLGIVMDDPEEFPSSEDRDSILQKTYTRFEATH